MSRSYLKIAQQYSDDVLSGKIVACKWIKAACQRQVDDLARKQGGAWRYRFDKQKAERVCRFVESLHHTKGVWARRAETIKLEPWQCFWLTTLYGWVDQSGNRRFRIAYVEVARKNAKSTIAAALFLYHLAADGETGAGVYSAATTRDQARIVFNDAKAMVRKNADLRDELGVREGAHALTIPDNDSTAQPLSADANTLDGLNISFAVVDELHAHPTRAVWDVIETATGSREQPLVKAITTAGFDRSSICYEQKTYVEKIMNAVLARHDGMGYDVTGQQHEDETYFGLIYTLDEDDDWQDEHVWAKANPNLGVSVFVDDIRRLARKAAETSSAVSNFLTKRLNVWVGAEQSWMNMVAWNRSALTEFELEDYRGEPCIVGLDLAARLDIAAMVGVIVRPNDQLVIFGRYYCPEDRVEESANSQYRGWANDGYLIDTDGAEIDFSRIRQDLLGIAQVLDVRMVAFDKWQSVAVQQTLRDEGFTADMVEVPQSFAGMSAPMKELESAVLAGRVKHDGNPVMAWMMGNVKRKIDANDNIRPVKSTDEAKIDGPVAAIMAMHAVGRLAGSISVYESRGAVVL